MHVLTLKETKPYTEYLLRKLFLFSSLLVMTTHRRFLCNGMRMRAIMRSKQTKRSNDSLERDWNNSLERDWLYRAVFFNFIRMLISQILTYSEPCPASPSVQPFGCDTRSHNWLIGKALSRCLDQSQHSPAGTIGGMLAARCAVGMEPFRQCNKSHARGRGGNREVDTLLEASSG